MDRSRRTALALLLAAAACVLSVGAIRPAEGPSQRTCSSAGMVVTASPPATAVGQEILARGGNAVDAAVAVGFALAVAFPEAGNIGGGGFMLLRTAGGEIRFIDFRETAPRSANRNMYLDERGEVAAGASTAGHRAVGVPGTIAGLSEAHRRYGSLPWPELVEPAVRLAEHGFTVDSRLASSLERLQRYRERFPALAVFMGNGGEALREGESLRQPELAAVLRRIAARGEDDFYRGETADLIVAEMRSGGGCITREDLADYRALLREPVRGLYRGYEVISAPPPSSGGIVLLEILNMVEGFPLSDFGRRSDRFIHVLVEAEKRAYADRARYLGDPDYIQIPVSYLISREYASHLRSSITERSTPAAQLNGGGLNGYESAETTHYSIVDRFGNAVATTTTLNGAYGSKVVVRGGGFLLNNEMDDFSLKPGVPNMYGLTGGEANAIEPGKRMLSSMAPTIVQRDGAVRLVLGTPGGSTIITTVAQVIIGIIDFGLSPEEAVSAPRFHHQWSPDSIEYERVAFTEETLALLTARGHVCKERAGAIGDVQLIMLEDSTAYGVSDPRGGGEARGCGESATTR